MKKLTVLLTFCLVIGLCGGIVSAQVNNLNEPGSLLVFPLIDNINYTTIIEIANRAATDVWLQCYMITHGIGPVNVFDKKDFYIHLTQKEPFWWSTNQPYNRVDAHGVITQIQGFAGRKGCLFCWAIDSDKTQLEIDWDFLKGDAMLYNGGNGRAWQYNAIPHQGIAVVGDRRLNLDGVEYTMATSQIMFEGFAEGFSGIFGTLAVCNLNIDFILSIQPRFDINLECWNQNEVAGTRHLAFYQFNQYDLTRDLQLAINQVFTPKWQCATVSTNALWAVFFQWTGGLAWGSNVWQHPLTGRPATVVLPPVPLGD
jgi:hypothetical protein